MRRAPDLRRAGSRCSDSFEPHGLFAIGLMRCLVVEVFITLADFIEGT